MKWKAGIVRVDDGERIQVTHCLGMSVDTDGALRVTVEGIGYVATCRVEWGSACARTLWTEFPPGFLVDARVRILSSNRACPASECDLALGEDWMLYVQNGTLKRERVCLEWKSPYTDEKEYAIYEGDTVCHKDCIGLVHLGEEDWLVQWADGDTSCLGDVCRKCSVFPLEWVTNKGTK